MAVKKVVMVITPFKAKTKIKLKHIYGNKRPVRWANLKICVEIE